MNSCLVIVVAVAVAVPACVLVVNYFHHNYVFDFCMNRDMYELQYPLFYYGLTVA